MAINRKEYYRKFLSFFHLLVCFTGFAYQFVDLTDYYLQYPATIDLLVKMPEEVKSPDTSLCIRYPDVLDYGRINRDKGWNISHNPLESSSNKMILDLLTLEEIFNYTPSKKVIFESCMIRFPQSYAMLSQNASRCQFWFNVTTFYSGEYICYKFTTKSDETFTNRHIAYAPTFPGIMYEITLNMTAFAKLDTFKAVVHPHKTLPAISIAYAAFTRRAFNKRSKTYGVGGYDLGFKTINVIRLPAPYQTNCRNYMPQFLSDLWCRQTCMQAVTKREFNKVPFLGMYTSAEKYKHISPNDVNNITFAKALGNAEKRCYLRCYKEPCTEEYSLTLIAEKPDEENVFFSLNAAREPNFFIEFKPVLRIQEFLVLMFSIFGTWFGLSMFSLNPARVIREDKKKLRDNARSNYQRAIRLHSLKPICYQPPNSEVMYNPLLDARLARIINVKPISLEK